MSRPTSEELPLTVLASEGPQARAYLVRSRRAGFRFRRIVLMVSQRHPATGKPLGGWLPRAIREAYAERVQTQAQLHWPQWIRRRHPGLVESISQGLAEVCPEHATILEEMYGSFRWEDHGLVERMLVDGLRDPSLPTALGQGSPVLYTGGGIVPGSLIDHTRFVHVHPGFLPQARGADCLLWSLLVRGRPSMSGFFMARGIDTGDLILARDFPPLQIRLSGNRPDDQTLYRALFSFCDPLLRAEFLVGDLLSTPPGSWVGQPQSIADGLTYHFMHRTLREGALRRLFV